MSEPRRGALLGAAILVTLAATPARAGLPGWAKEIAEAAPEVPEAMPEWPSRILFDEKRIVVSEDGATWRVRARRAVQYLSNRVDETAVGSFVFDDTVKIKTSKGWHVPRGERAKRNVGGALDLGMSDAFLTDAKARVVALEGVRKGSLVFYEFDAESRPYALTDREAFGGATPLTLARVTVELPPGWTLRHAWLPGAGPEPVRSDNAWTFEQRDWVPVPVEELGAPPASLSPTLVFAISPPAGVKSGAPAFSDWDDLARWYRDISKGRDAPGPDVQSATTKILADAGGARLARVRAVAMFVRDRVRYLARNMGIGGYQPRPASQVLSELYGDCKDKGTLFRAMLAADGIASYPILVHASSPSTVAQAVPDLRSFDHFVVGVVWDGDAALPEDAVAAAVDAGEAGRLLVVDTTDEYAWPGTLPANLAGKTGLVLEGSHGRLVTFPEGRPEAHRAERRLDITVEPAQSARATMESRYFGAFAEFAREANASSSLDRRKDVEGSVREMFPGAEITDYRTVPEDRDGAYVQSVSFTIPTGSAAFQDSSVAMFSGAGAFLRRVPLAKRVGPVVFPFPIRVRYDSTVRGLRTDAALPAPQDVSGDGWAVGARFDRDGGVVHGVWTVSLSRVRFEPSTFPELKAFWSAASRASSPSISIEK